MAQLNKSRETKKDLDKIKAIDHGVIAYPHTPVYKMHRYFARRPWSVFNELIQHYSNPGNIILDPFCGGGVTIVEGLKLERKVIGVDFNPLATFITEMEVCSIDFYKFDKALERIENLRKEIESLYMTTCPKCKREVPASWLEYSNVVDCNKCHKPVKLSEAQRVIKGEKIAGVSAGKFKCTNRSCDNEFRPAECKRIKEEIILVHVSCPRCKQKSEFAPNKRDFILLDRITSTANNIIKKRGLYNPKSKMPDWWELRRPYNAHIKSFSEWFTKRNLLANAILATEIKKEKDEEIKKLLTFIFSASLRFTNRIVFRNPGWQGGKPIEWASSVYWLPEIFCEVNVWEAWKNRLNAVKKGKKYSQEEIGAYYIGAKAYKDLKDSATCLTLTESSTNLSLPDSSVDAIITDPPYGNNILYAELCNFYWVWVSGILDRESMINDKEEAIISKEHDKDLKKYRNLLYKIFKECCRVLKDGRWMVMTFHNKDFAVWNAIHLAAHDAGFILSEEDGMIYQPPIKNYINTIQTRRSGSMLGDFILSFKKTQSAPKKKLIPAVEIEKRIQELASEAILHHKGATLSVIYMKLIPFLLNNNLLDKINESSLTTYLKENFEEKDGKWYLKEQIGRGLEEYLSKYSESHYKQDYRVLDFIPVEARLEYLIRRFLYEKSSATQDDVLNEIYTNLINSNAADYGEISKVLNRIAKLTGESGRKVWKLKEDLARIEQLNLIEEKVKEVVETTEESEHDLMIERLVDLGAKEGYASHIGNTEQRKYTRFRQISIPMANNVQYGIDKKGFDIITEIDVLWLKGDSIVAAFEVERSTTINSGIDRFRNLFAVQPNSKIDAVIVIPDKRESETIKKISSPANKNEGLTDKIGYILFSKLKINGSIQNIDFKATIKYLE
ncbi:MAG: DNA methyltransferase [Candidatus Levyibacteriota bacterium]